ncbi:DUF6484 domain-containing protein [Myxococcus virescens]|uniref:DUF6484 domain-containing protein n=1 Tax=Myxococcus virescens TaxID=83456 RepID=A0ABY0NDZ3_9BACT|nr:hypothetical protein SAMN04488504_1244 [Myxococcus virescens]
MRAKAGETVPFVGDAEEPRVGSRGPRVGWLVGVDGEGNPQVDFEGNTAGPLSARTIIPMSPKVLADATARRPGAVLLFEQDDLSRPVLIGLLQPASTSPLVEALLSGAADSESALDAHVDGRRVVLEGKEEVVLRCGEATITLRRNGKVVIRGVQVETHATGTNRIKGASVKVN